MHYHLDVLQVLLILPGFIIGRIVAAPAKLAPERMEGLVIPDDLMIGVAGSAIQTEGAWNVSGKSASNWDVFIHENKALSKNEINADVACDSYHKYKDDIKLAKGANFQFFRMSLSWSRILPTNNPSHVNHEAIEHYRKVFDEVERQGMEVFLTIYHWDHPVALDERGGWREEFMVDAFTEYATVVFDYFSDRIKFWTTINEPAAYCTYGHGKGYFPPGEVSTASQYLCGHHMLIAHAKVYRLFKQYYQRNSPDSKIGIVNTCWNFYPVNPSQPESSDIAYEYNCGWLSNPIFSLDGDYPTVMKERIEKNSLLKGLKQSELPKLSEQLIERIKNSSDYFGLNYYTSRMSEIIVPKSASELYEDDSGVRISIDEKWPTDAASWLPIVPEGLGDMLRRIKNKYNNPPVYILENGLATNGKIDDWIKIKSLYYHMQEMLNAKSRDGCNVKGFGIWSLLDSWEWLSGYSQPFGLVHVDHKHSVRTRTPRTSYYWIRDVIKNRKLPQTLIRPTRPPITTLYYGPGDTSPE